MTDTTIRNDQAQQQQQQQQQHDSSTSSDSPEAQVAVAMDLTQQSPQTSSASEDAGECEGESNDMGLEMPLPDDLCSSSSSTSSNEGEDSSKELPQEDHQHEHRSHNTSHHHHHHHTHPEEPQRSFLGSVFDKFRHVFSLGLTGFCVAVVGAAIFTEQTTATAEKNVPPTVAFITFWVLLLWLALMEGALNCMVGLKPVDRNLYQHSHKKTFLITQIAHRGDNLERFIVGRQYLDLTVVFITSFMVSTIEGASVFGLPDIWNNIFLDAGLAVILVTIIFGQLVAQINSAHNMLDFTNNLALFLTTYLALAVELSGILHAVYLVQIFFAHLSGKPIESAEPPRSIWQKLFFWGRVLMSVAILGMAFAVSLTALFGGNTMMWPSVPPAASVVLLFGLILICGLMEGLQISLFAIMHLPRSEIDAHPRAKRNMKVLVHGHNLQAFLVGRQIVQTVIMFVIARITTVDMKDGSGNLFGVSDGVQHFFDTGILGALLSTIVASLSWRIIASSFPIVFLANPFAGLIIRFCLIVEWTGICYSSWFFAAIHQRVCGFQLDSTYIEGGIPNEEDKAHDLDLELAEEGSAPGTDNSHGSTSSRSVDSQEEEEEEEQKQQQQGTAA